MKFGRLGRLIASRVCLYRLLCLATVYGSLYAQQGQPQPTSPQQANPFEAPQQVAPDQPQPPKQQPFEAPKTAEQPAPVEASQDIVEAIEFRGSRRVPQDTLRALIFTKKGDRFDEQALQRDFLALWNTGRFDDIRLEREQGRTGAVIRFVVTERRVVRTIKYEGTKSVTTSEILDRFKERRVGLSVESQYDPNKVQRAANVLKEFLAERGRQFATVDPDVRSVPPASLEVTFKVKEGPKVKVGDIAFEGNSVFSDLVVRRAMRNLKPIGVPRSIFLENMFSKAYDLNKLEQDKEMVRNFYQERGYFMARVLDHEVKVRDVGGSGFRIPVLYPNKPGKRADLSLRIEEGRLYHLNKINFNGVKLFRTPETLMRPLFQMSEGDVFSIAKLRKGIENMRKLYGEFGYIDFVPEPQPEPQPGTDKIDLTFNVDEGKQFFVRRIDFTGNNTTRDKVIRREILVEEGDMYNTRLWDVSLLRLNQLGYFEQLKEEEAADIKRDTRTNTVDITLKVKERGKNSIQLNGGVSGIAGSFIGFGYSTNNFIGLGETLSLDAQLGDRIRNVTFGFTEPYLFDRPLQAGFTIFTNRFNYDQGREVSLFSGRNFLPLYESLGRENTLNYVSQGYGFTAFLSAPWKRTFARWSLSYGYDTQNIQTLSQAAKNQFEFYNFRSISGPNALDGIVTSRIIPSYTYNTVNHPITPTGGKSLYFSSSIAGGPLGGNVNMIEPSLDFKYFKTVNKRGHVVGFHTLGRFITGYGGRVAPPFNRFYMGGENDIRGFDIWSIMPIVFIPSETSVPVLNNDGTARGQRIINSSGVEEFNAVTQKVPYYQTSYTGGDTQVVTNLEYRIRIAGPVVLAAFLDTGVNRVSLASQLGLAPQRIKTLNDAFPQANFDGRAKLAEASQRIRMSTGLELQIMMPVVNAPFRFYWAYNPMIVNEIVPRPIVADRSFFPNQATYLRTLTDPNLDIGNPVPLVYERRRVFRFTISRTF